MVMAFLLGRAFRYASALPASHYQRMGSMKIDILLGEIFRTVSGHASFD